MAEDLIDFSKPCTECVEGHHDSCAVLCACIAFHADDSDILRGFKVLKQAMHPEREAWTRGGWTNP